MLNIDFKNCEIIYNDFNIDFSKSLMFQVDNLKEDMLQVKYNKNYILDIGWYPEFNINGNFILYVIKDYNWENYILKRKCKTIKDLKKYINEIIKYIENL